MDRRTVDPLIVKGETVRDGDALAQQASESTFAIVLYIVALVSLSLAMWMLVLNRRIRTEGLEGGLTDETQSVVDDMTAPKIVPEFGDAAKVAPLPAQPAAPPAPAQPAAPGQRPPPPLPPTGLPEGWTQDQWNHFGWQYVESMKK